LNSFKHPVNDISDIPFNKDDKRSGIPPTNNGPQTVEDRKCIGVDAASP